MGKLTSLEELKKYREFKAREVYKIPDEKVIMERDQSTVSPAKDRYVLIISSQDLLDLENYSSVNIVPLTNSGNEDLFSFPISKQYSDLANGFKPSSNSKAIVYFYQPIKKEFLGDYCGTIDETCYHGIVNTICISVVGLNDYDLSP